MEQSSEQRHIKRQGGKDLLFHIALKHSPPPFREISLPQDKQALSFLFADLEIDLFAF